jgi:hypothetical protein
MTMTISGSKVEESLLNNAIKLYKLLPHIDSSGLLFAVGMQQVRAESHEMKEIMLDMKQSCTQRNGLPVLASDKDSTADRAALLTHLMKQNPAKNDARNKKQAIKLTEAMKLVGFSAEEAKMGQAIYIKCVQCKKKLDAALLLKQQQPQLQQHVATNPQTPHLPQVNTTSTVTIGHQQVLLPLTLDSNIPSSPTVKQI